MKKIITSMVLIMSSSLTVFAETDDTLDYRLSAALKSAGVPLQAHRDYQEANVICRVPKDGETGKLLCDITNRSNQPMTTQPVDGDLAREVSSLLGSFGVKPIGHRDYQEANVICRIPKYAEFSKPICDVTNLSE